MSSSAKGWHFDQSVVVTLLCLCPRINLLREPLRFLWRSLRLLVPTSWVLLELLPLAPLNSLNAELCIAVAAALLRAARARALANFIAQSGRISSVVITSGAVAGNDPRLTPSAVPLLLLLPTDPPPLLLSKVLEVNVAVDEFEKSERGVAWRRPVLFGLIPLRYPGATNVTPKSGIMQNGQQAGSEIIPIMSFFRRSAAASSSLSLSCGGCGSARLIATKHSVQMGCSQQRVLFIDAG